MKNKEQTKTGGSGLYIRVSAQDICTGEWTRYSRELGEDEIAEEIAGWTEALTRQEIIDEFEDLMKEIASPAGDSPLSDEQWRRFVAKELEVDANFQATYGTEIARKVAEDD